MWVLAILMVLAGLAMAATSRYRDMLDLADDTAKMLWWVGVCVGGLGLVIGAAKFYNDHQWLSLIVAAAVISAYIYFKKRGGQVKL